MSIDSRTIRDSMGQFSNLLKNNFLTVVNVGGTAQVDSSLLSVRAF